MFELLVAVRFGAPIASLSPGPFKKGRGISLSRRGLLVISALLQFARYKLKNRESSYVSVTTKRRTQKQCGSEMAVTEEIALEERDAAGSRSQLIRKNWVAEFPQKIPREPGRVVVAKILPDHVSPRHQ
jgi:hypothetical protein